jgi:hypothetical protein
MVVEPPSLEPIAYPAALLESGLLRVLRDDQPADPKQLGRVRDLVAQWEQWRDQMRGTGKLEALKAGIKLEEDQEASLSDIRRDIRQYGQEMLKEDMPPQYRADLVLHLAHLQDAEAAELEGLLSGVENFNQELASVMGLGAEDAEPADFQDAGMDRLPPLDYSLPGGQRLESRLSAWATLAAGLVGPEARLATNMPAVAQWLVDTANQRLDPEAGGRDRSPAGASHIDNLILPPDADSPLAQEAFRLELPDLAGLSAEELAELHQGLKGSGDLEGLQEATSVLFQRLANGPWGAELCEGLRGQAGEAAAAWARAVENQGIQSGDSPRAWRVLAFPGLGRDDLFTMMRQGGAGGLPGPDQWTDGRPKEATPLVVI